MGVASAGAATTPFTIRRPDHGAAGDATLLPKVPEAASLFARRPGDDELAAMLGRTDEALAKVEEALRIDPSYQATGERYRRAFMLTSSK